jgi:uncharacterized protein with HEPN domain
MKKDSLAYIKHIRDAINLVEDFIEDYTKRKFLCDELVQSAVIRQIEIIGEAVKNIPLSFRNKYSKIPWAKVARMRDKLIHQYFGVDLDKVWDVVKDDLPKLKKQIKEILKAEE